jgi:YVTN family beta-propeller protein
MRMKLSMRLAVPLVGLLLVSVLASWAGKRVGAESGQQGTEPVTNYLPFIAQAAPVPAVPFVVATIALPPGSHPHGIDLDVTGQRAFIGNHLSNSLAVLDTAGLTLGDVIPLSGAIGPNGVAYNPAADRVYVANRDTGNVSLVDPTGGQWLANIAVGALPNGLVLQNHLLYVANFGSDSVSMINVQQNTVAGTISVGSQPALLAGEYQPAGGNSPLFLSSHGDDRIYFLQGGVVIGNRPGVPKPYGLALDPIAGRLYATNRGLNHSVTALDISLNAIEEFIDVGQEAYVAAANPRTGHLFVASGDRVMVYDRRDHALIATIPVASGAEEGIAIDPSRNRVYVTSGESDRVTIIQDIQTFDLAYTEWRSTGMLVNMDDTGIHQRVLAGPDLNFSDPSWRPDGRLLVYAAYSYLTGESDIYLVETGGGQQLNLTTTITDTEDLQPAWSPDGQQIAWRREWRIWLMDADGSNQTPLTPAELTARDPIWSPDGQWLSFVAWDGDHEDVFIIPAAGGATINVSNHPEVDLGQSWSADSQALVFESDRDGNWEIYKADLTDPDNIELVRLTDDLANDHAAVWSPDGSQIAFISDRDFAEFEFSVWLMNPDGSDQRRLTEPYTFLRPMSWSPDGRWLASRAGYGFAGQIYKVDTLTGVVIRLTNSGFSVMDPVWRPDTWR